MRALLMFIPLVFLVACRHSTQSKSPQNQPASNIPYPIEISHTQWEELGKPLYNIDAYKQQFYRYQLQQFAITEDLVHKADQSLYRLSKEEYVQLFQRHTTPETMNVKHHKIMHQEYLYTHEGTFCIEVDSMGQEKVVPTPIEQGYKVDFTTLYSANPADNKYSINMIFHANSTYGNPQNLERYDTKGLALCCSFPSTLAQYEKNDTMEYSMSSELLEFPYFKRTEVKRSLKDNLTARVDSTIMILKFGIHRVLSVGDQQQFINGRLEQDFVNAQLQLDLEY